MKTTFKLITCMLILGFSMISLSKVNAQTYTQSTCSFSPFTLSSPTSFSPCDDCSFGPVTLPFTFNFYGAPQTTVFASTNGFLSFGAVPAVGNGCCSGQVLPNGNFTNSIALAWSDWVSTVSYQTFGITPNRVFVMNWSGYEFAGGLGNIDAQIALFETTNEIRLITTNNSNVAHNMTQGLNQNGSVADPVPGRNSVIWNTSANCVSFMPVVVAPPAGYNQNPCSFSPFTLSSPTVLGTFDDFLFGPVALPFTFNFYGVAQTTMFASTNGFISLGPAPGVGQGCCSGQALPNGGFANSIALGWMDWISTVSYQTFGIAPNRVFVINWSGSEYACGGPINAQIALFETTNEIRLITTTNGNVCHTQTQGLNLDGATANPVPGRNNTAWTASSECISFTPIVVAAPPGYVQNPCSYSPFTLSSPTVLGFCDDCLFAVALPFSFNFYGVAQTNMFVSTNGFLSLGAAPFVNNGCCSGQVLPNGNFANSIALAWTDWVTTVSYQTFGVSPNQVLVINWTGSEFGGGGGVIDGQIALFQTTGEIRLISTTNSNTGISGHLKTQGLNKDGTTANPVPGRNATHWSASSECISFTPSGATAPQITCPANVSVSNDPSQCAAIVNYPAATATGSPTPTVTYSQNSGTSFPVGTTNVTATATNANGTAACTFTVTVTDDEDPTIICPPAVVSVFTDPGVCYATNVNLGSPVIGDNCPGSTFANNAPVQFPQGGTIVQWEVTDASGNKDDCTQLVSVIDNEPPVARCKNICIYLNSGGTATITGADINDGSTDNCGIDPGPNGLVASQTSFSYIDAGPNTVTLTVLDVNGNTSTCTSIVTVGEYYTLFGAGPTCSTPAGQPDACHVHIGNGNTVSGNVGSYRLVSTGGGVAINGNVYSGGKVNYANGVSSKSIAVANLLGQSGNVLSTGNSAIITGDVDVMGNIYINQNAGSSVSGIVRHPAGTTYSGPVPGGGVLVAPPVLPALPGMPTINAYGCGGANITTTATLNPGSYGNLILGNASGIIITFNGPGNYYFSSIKMGQGGIHTFKYDFLGLPGKINIFVCGDIDFGTHYSQWANPNTPDACRVYFETHGTGSTNGTNGVYSAIIALGSQFYGRIWAPYGGIKIGSGSCCTYATGSFWSAKQVQLEGAVTISRCGSTCPPGPRFGQDGTTAEDMKDMLQVYPNPTTGQTTVSFFAETPDNYTLKVMDYQGRVVLSNNLKSIAGDNTLEVDMSQFAKGLYLIEVGNTDHSQKVKLVVQ